MLKIEHIKGRDLVEALNNAEDLIYFLDPQYNFE